MQDNRVCDPSACLVQEAVDAFLRVFQMTPRTVDVLSVTGGIVQLRVRCRGTSRPHEDLFRIRLRQHLQLAFPCLRGTVIQFDPSE